MKILDNNTINYIFDNNITLAEVYYVTPDVRDEAEIAEIVRGKKVPSNVRDIIEEELFDFGVYLNNYQIMLNQYEGRSFYSMRGFGDISILAALKVMEAAFNKRMSGQLFDDLEELVVFTEDGPLSQKIKKEFSASKRVKVQENKNIK